MPADVTLSVDRASVERALLRVSPERIIVARRALMIQAAKVGEAVVKRNVPRRTANLQRSIRGVVGPDGNAVITATARYAKWVDEGTGIYGPRGQRIYPTHARVLAWPGGVAGGPGARLTGSPRSGTPGNMQFARSIAGMRPRHYIKRSREEIDAMLPGILEVAARAFEAAA